MADKAKYGYQILGANGEVLQGSQYEYDTPQAAADAADVFIDEHRQQNPPRAGVKLVRNDGKDVTDKDFEPAEPIEPDDQ